MQWLACFLALLACGRGAESTLAFPGAEGAGRFASGGRGGEVVRVTNLNASGPGSLADAVSGPDRIVVFEVSGVIDLTRRAKGGAAQGGIVRLEHPNITIAGQSAPGEGICLKGGTLSIAASNVIIRHLRVRRGVIAEGDSGDAVEIKPPKGGEPEHATGRDQAVFEKIKIKKAGRGKTINEFGELSDVILDHVSTSWATDENLTLTKAERTTAQFCIAAEGLDYANPRQTPPNHSEGSLWGSATPNGRSTVHHSLYAHNRLRNPRTTGGPDEPAVLTFYNNVVYDWSEYPSHTGSERVHLNWVNNTYRPGPSTPASVRGTMFIFMGDPGARIFAHGNVIESDERASADNRRAIVFDRKLAKLAPAERAAMIANAMLGEPPSPESLEETKVAFARVLDDAGATLPARDSVDARIVAQVRDGAGRVIEKETSLAPRERWPEYRSLPPPADRDRDGMPDFWEEQFGLNADDPADAMQIAAGGYANIEHYLNSTHPLGADLPMVFVAARQSRASASAPGRFRITRTGSTAHALRIGYTLEGDAVADRDFSAVAREVVIPAGARTADIDVQSLAPAEERIVVLRLAAKPRDYAAGCPSAALVVLEGP